MDNIFEVEDWLSIAEEVPARVFRKNDIVSYEGYFYYAIIDHELDIGFPPSPSSTEWGGVTITDTGETKPIFYWDVSHGTKPNFNFRVTTNQMGDGYTQRVADGINNDLMEIDVVFSERDFAEIKAISHFLYSRKGYESFLFTPPRPFQKMKRFICPDFGPTFVFYNNFTINTKFIEVVA